MKSRGFLKPFATSVSALLGIAQAGLVAEPAFARAAGEASISVPSASGELTLAQGNERASDLTSDAHASHSSHVSHASHASHSSHSSSSY